MRKFWSSVWEILEVVLISVATVFIIRTFLAQPFLVSGASMEPTFHDGNYLIVDEITYRFREPQRGEVVVFRYPKERKTFFIKRIIGLPNDRVIIQQNKLRLFSNGKEIILDEDYLKDSASTAGSVNLELGPDQYFVLGDNRYNSFDSRNWGPIARKDIIGIVRLRLLPIKQIGIVENPSY
ncbi:MAG: signal peptidase I [Patescibacteria group bacterium]